MVNFRNKSEQVYAQGALERGEFQPTGAPLKVYQYWHSRTKNAPENENFCHFWRVVAFWAPLMWVRSILARMAQRPLTWLFIFLAYAVGMLVLGATVDWAIPFFTLAIPMAAVGTSIGGEAAQKYNKVSEIQSGMKYPFWVTALVSIPTFYLFRYFNGLSDREQEVWANISGITLASALTILVGFIIVTGAMEIGWVILYYIFGIPLGLVVAFFSFAALGTGIEFIINRIRARNKRKEGERTKSINEQYDAFLRGEGENPFAIKRHVPGPREQKIINFFKGIGDFLSLAWNIVRVNKWKICPMVKIDSDPTTK